MCFFFDLWLRPHFLNFAYDTFTTKNCLFTPFWGFFQKCDMIFWSRNMMFSFVPFGAVYPVPSSSLGCYSMNPTVAIIGFLLSIRRSSMVNWARYVRRNVFTHTILRLRYAKSHEGFVSHIKQKNKSGPVSNWIDAN